MEITLSVNGLFTIINFPTVGCGEVKPEKTKRGMLLNH